MDKIEELLTRGVDTIYPSQEDLEKMLRSGKKLKIYQGFDPTGIQLHIGHMVGFRKLAHWQKAGHKVVFLIGTGTGLAGDPSGKTRAREKYLSEEELKQNAKDYVMQAKKLVNFDGENPVEIVYNGDWLNKLTLKDILDIAGHFSLQQLAERDMFQDRMKKGEDVNLREFLYPLLQGYDSVAISADAELGGTDQTFNMLAGRKLVREMQNREKFVMTTPLLTDSEGRKIGKTEGNVIALNDKPEDLFGKIMSLSDDIIVKGLEYLTDVPMDEVEKVAEELKAGAHPVEHKKRLAFEIVKQLNHEEAAKSAQEYFERTVQKKEMPSDVPTVTEKDLEKISLADAIKEGRWITDVLVALNLAPSASEAKRLVQQGAVSIDGEKILDPKQLIKLDDNMILKVGKRNYIRITLD
ncbi:MAG TPA: tyrosine--tRNA ligase [Patescibacteria group bacterium]|nr:tyrosine--tRNA ligase [Patescibacteria group bacterium]